MPDVTANITTISDCEATTGWSGPTLALEPDLLVEGSNSISGIVRNDATTIEFTGTIPNSGDLSNQHIRFWVNTSVYGIMELLASGGLEIYVGDGTNTAYWNVAGKDTYAGGWLNIVVDIESSPISGSVNSSSVTTIGIRFQLTASYKRVINTYIDYLRYGDGLVIKSATTEAVDFTDAADADSLTTNGWGVIRLVDGVLFCSGELVLGDASTSDTLNFVSSGETLYFQDREVSTALYKIKGVASATATTDIDITGLVCKTVGATGAEVDFSDTDVDSLAIDGSTFIDMGGILLYGNATNDALITSTKFDGCGTTTLNQYADVSACSWNLSGQITQSSAAIDGCTISNSSATSALLCNDPDLITGTHFESDGTGHAVELTSACAGNSYDWVGNTDNGYAATDGSTGNEVLYNNSGGAVTITIDSSSDVPTVRNGTGASTTIITNTVTVSVKVIALDTGLPIENARVLVTKTVGGATVLSGLTNASGIIQDTSYSYTADEGIEGWARKSSATPFYVQATITGTITSTGFSATAAMAKDE